MVREGTFVSPVPAERDMHWAKWLRRFPLLRRFDFLRDAPARAGDIERLRSEFKSRYHNFKLLLTANNKALVIMAEIEEALRGVRLLGMSFVRSRCTRVATNVFQMLKSLNELAPGKYEALYERFVAIQGRITPFLHSEDIPEEGAWIVPLEELDRTRSEQVGYKMASLGELANRLGFSIPNGFVITAQAYRQFMQHQQLAAAIDELIQSEEPSSLDGWSRLSEEIRRKIVAAPLPRGLAAVISRAYRQLEAEEGTGVPVAMRSSALGEDVPGVSFAGQYLTELNVRGASILDSYKRIVASKYGPHAMIYRMQHGVRDDGVAMCVGCMPMVDSVAGGVAYTNNPVNPKDPAILVQSVWGLPRPVTDGTVSSDLFVVSRDRPFRVLRRRTAVKSSAFRLDGDEYRTVPAGESAAHPSLSDHQVLELSESLLEIESHFGCAQDVEWALAGDGTFVLLQSRPLHETTRESPTSLDEEALEGRDIILSGGMTASSGVGSGPVFVVRKEADVLDFPGGSVLVAAQALPDWATVLDRAAAVITEHGSIVGHLANVARELQVPALFGVEGALDRLVNVREVTVDADGTRVIEGRVEAASRSPRPPAPRTIGSPVYQALKGAADYILPLRLLDPDSPGFKPQNCTTFHDITRFCHERAVQEMFELGTERSFPERSARQLHCDVPMQFWVIDLEDGFAAGAPADRYIRMEHIVSIPMLALWRGMTAVRWEGPPPVDTRGFMSIVMQSATDPGLDPSLRAKYAARNYFMISKNFCSLHSRFGYHFSTVEALVSERDSENYLSFMFKGGAANLDRRAHRARLVAEVLEEVGYRTELTEDCVRARLEGYPQPFMESGLEALGYLILHTRQLDMVMAGASSIGAHKQKLLNDLEKILQPGNGR